MALNSHAQFAQQGYEKTNRDLFFEQVSQITSCPPDRKKNAQKSWGLSLSILERKVGMEYDLSRLFYE